MIVLSQCISETMLLYTLLFAATVMPTAIIPAPIIAGFFNC